MHEIVFLLPGKYKKIFLDIEAGTFYSSMKLWLVNQIAYTNLIKGEGKEDYTVQLFFLLLSKEKKAQQTETHTEENKWPLGGFFLLFFQ